MAAELNRHKGRLLLRRGHSAAAEELYRKALSRFIPAEGNAPMLQAFGLRIIGVIDGMRPENQVRSRLSAGGDRIRTFGPSASESVF